MARPVWPALLWTIADSRPNSYREAIESKAPPRVPRGDFRHFTAPITSPRHTESQAHDHDRAAAAAAAAASASAASSASAAAADSVDPASR